MSFLRREPGTLPNLPLPPLDLLSLARSLAAGVRHGRHRSLARGGSAEFYDYRAYAPGDPLRHLDWRLLGRTDRAYLRRYQHECRISLILVVDASPSMDFAGLDESTAGKEAADERAIERLGGSSGAACPRRSDRPTKLRRTCELAAALAYLAVKAGDDIGLVLADGVNCTVFRPAGGWAALNQVVRALERAMRRREPIAPTTDEPNALAEGLRAAEAIVSRGSVVVALSDALDEPSPVLDALARLRFAPIPRGRAAATIATASARCDAALIQVLSDDELDLSLTGPARLIDRERRLAVDADADDAAEDYAAAIRSHIDSLRRGLIAARGRHVLCPLSRPPIDALRELLAE